MSKIIYLDMDGVLADFNGEMIRVFGKSFKELGDAPTRWALISEQCPDVYKNLQALPDADDLIAGVVEVCVTYDYTPAILTAIPKFGRIPLAVEHKKEWLRTRWPILAANFNIGPHAVDKQNHAQPGRILIDDSDLNIPQWNDKGGFGILHTSAKDSLQKLKQYVEEQHGRLSRYSLS